MIGVFCVVILSCLLLIFFMMIDEFWIDFFGNLFKVEIFYVEVWFGFEVGVVIIDWFVLFVILFLILIMVLVGFVMECGLIKYFYKCLYVDQIFVMFGFVIVLQEIIKYFFGVNLILMLVLVVFVGSFDFGVMVGFDFNIIIYFYWCIVYFLFVGVIIGVVFVFFQFIIFGMVVCVGMVDC